MPSPEHFILEVAAGPAKQTVVIKYHKDLLSSGSAQTNGNPFKQGFALNGFWHPRLDTDTYFELTAEVPAGFEAISEADSIEIRSGRQTRIFRFHFPHGSNPVTRILRSTTVHPPWAKPVGSRTRLDTGDRDGYHAAAVCQPGLVKGADR